MTRINPDDIVLTSLLDTYLNYDTSTGSIIITAQALADTASVSFVGLVPFTRDNSRADLYFTTSALKVPANASSRIPTGSVYTFVSFETVNVTIQYSSLFITVTLQISNNTGGPINIVGQTIGLLAVQYDAPFSTLTT